MTKYFDKAFFHFLLGFAGILAASFVLLIAVGYYEMEIKSNTERAQVETP